jgi:hypothetical protein
MVQRRFGPTQGAGVVVIEKESEKVIVPSALGSTAYVGVLERGPVDEVIEVSSKRDLLAKTGGIIKESMLPDCAQHFWDDGQGAGLQFLTRVTDGDEEKAYVELWDRAPAASKQKVIKLEAKDGGGWGGRRQTYVMDMDDADPDGGFDITGETTIALPLNFIVKKDQLKGGTIHVTESNQTYNIESNTASLDTSTQAVVTLTGEAKAQTDYGTSAGDAELIIEVLSQDSYKQDKHLAVIVKNGAENPSTEFGLEIYLDDTLVISWPDLSMDSDSDRYLVDIIENDDANHYVAATNLFSGVPAAMNRPANFYGSVADSEVASKIATLGTAMVVVDDSGAGDATIASFTFGSKVIADTYEVEVTGTSPTTWSLVSTAQQDHHTFPAPTDGGAYTADNDYSIGFTVTGGTPVIGEKFTLQVIPLVEDEAINGRIYLEDANGDKVTDSSNSGYLITDNDETTVTISNGDLTVDESIPNPVYIRVEYKQQFGFGYDGVAGIALTDFTKYYDVADSVYNDLEGKGYGLIKIATPGISSFSAGTLSEADRKQVEKDGATYAEAKNHQYRYEIQNTITDEFDAVAFVQDELGKNTFAKVIWPSWAYIADPILTTRLKEVPITGMVHGIEAKYAYTYNGYHKVAAGIDAKMTKIVKLRIKKKIPNEEILNPAGLQSIQYEGGNFVVWGAKIPTADTGWRFCQKRELMSYYEHVMQENFKYIIFAINDEIEHPGLITALMSFFIPEWTKRALRGNSFEEAARIKVDSENNTDLTMAQGDMHASISLKLADTTERLILTMSKAGIFEGVE